MTEAVIICPANQWTGFYMITASIMKELIGFFVLFKVDQRYLKRVDSAHLSPKKYS